MSYNDICIELLTNPNSPFKGHVWGNMSFVGLFYDFANLLAYGLSYLFKIFLDGMNNFAIGAYRFLSFSESSAVRSLYSLISKYVWIPILICGVIACFRIVLGGKNVGKQFIRNICILFVVTTLLPTLFNYINHDILGGYQKDETTGVYEDTTLFSHTLDTNDNKENQDSKKDEDIASLADTILRNNATDKIWLYDYAVKSGAIPDELDEKIKTMGDVSGTVNVMGAGTIEIPTEQYLGELTEKSSIKNVDSIFSELKKSDARSEWLESKEAKILTFDNGADMFNSKLTEHIHNDWNSAQDSNYSGTNVPSSSDDNTSGGSSKLDDLRTKYTEGVPNIYRLKAISTNSSEMPYGIQRLSDGTNLLGATGDVYLGKESYWRYDIDWFNIFIEMLAHAYVFFVIGYCAIKLIIELIVHQIFGGVMAAMDLSGGDRIKKYLTAIIGCYMGLLISVMVIPLFNAGCNFITSNMGIDSGFIKAMLEIVLAMVIVNVPNIISMYFGINTGARAGMALFGTGMYLSMKAAKAVKGAATNVGATALQEARLRAEQRRNRNNMGFEPEMNPSDIPYAQKGNSQNSQNAFPDNNNNNLPSSEPNEKSDKSENIPETKTNSNSEVNQPSSSSNAEYGNNDSKSASSDIENVDKTSMKSTNAEPIADNPSSEMVQNKSTVSKTSGSEQKNNGNTSTVPVHTKTSSSPSGDVAHTDTEGGLTDKDTSASHGTGNGGTLVNGQKDASPNNHGSAEKPITRNNPNLDTSNKSN